MGRFSGPFQRDFVTPGRSAETGRFFNNRRGGGQDTVRSDQVLFRRAFPEGPQFELGLGLAVLVDEGAEVFRLQARPDESAGETRSERLGTRDPPRPKAEESHAI